MQAIYNYVVSMEISTILCSLFVVVYGLSFAIKNWWIWFASLFNGKGFPAKRYREVIRRFVVARYCLADCCYI